MDWLTELFIGNSVAHTILVYAIVIAAGVLLGKIKIFGISLGATFVLFCGIFIGHLFCKVQRVENIGHPALVILSAVHFLGDFRGKNGHFGINHVILRMQGT